MSDAPLLVAIAGGDARGLLPETFAVGFETQPACIGVEALTAFLSRRKPDFEGA